MRIRQRKKRESVAHSPQILMAVNAVFAKKLASLALLLVFLPIQPLLAAKEEGAGNADLRLSIDVKGQKYCYPDDLGPIAYLDFGLTFTNVSRQAVILSRKIQPPLIARVAKSVDAANAGNYEWDPNTDSFVDKLPAAPSFGKRPDPKRFIILAPSESYEVTSRSAFFGAVNLAAAGKIRGMSPGGSYVLQVAVGTWPYEWPYFAPTDTRAQAERWNKYGNLAYGLLYSEFAPFHVPEKFENVRCKSH